MAMCMWMGLATTQYVLRSKKASWWEDSKHATSKISMQSGAMPSRVMASESTDSRAEGSWDLPTWITATTAGRLMTSITWSATFRMCVVSNVGLTIFRTSPARTSSLRAGPRDWPPRPALDAPSGLGSATVSTMTASTKTGSVSGATWSMLE